MSSTLVEQFAVTSGRHASQTVYHVHSWRPWMSMYGLRLRPRGAAQPEVQRLFFLWVSVVLSTPLEGCTWNTGRSSPDPEVVASRAHHDSPKIPSYHNTGSLPVCMQAMERLRKLSSSLAVSMPRRFSVYGIRQALSSCPHSAQVSSLTSVAS